MPRHLAQAVHQTEVAQTLGASGVEVKQPKQHSRKSTAHEQAGQSAGPLPGYAPAGLFELLEATPDGLSSAEANRRLRLHGPNSLVKESRFAALIGFLRFLANPLVLILLAASTISIVLRDPVGGSIIIAVPGR